MAAQAVGAGAAPPIPHAPHLPDPPTLKGMVPDLGRCEQLRKDMTARLRDVLKSLKWVEPMARPKGRAYEDVLISAVEDELRKLKAGFDEESRKGERTRVAMMDGLGKLEDDVVEKEHEIMVSDRYARRPCRAATVAQGG